VPFIGDLDLSRAYFENFVVEEFLDDIILRTDGSNSGIGATISFRPGYLDRIAILIVVSEIDNGFQRFVCFFFSNF